MKEPIDYCKLLTDWREQQQQRMRERFPNNQPLHNFAIHYHSEIKDQDTLLITVGDSWTWGASLEEDLRLKQIYGARLKEQLNSDWINIGNQGWSNSFILGHLSFLLDYLKQTEYKKIYFVVTLTENGRDITTFPHFRFNYHELFDRLGSSDVFYETLLQECENFWIKLINEAFDKMDERFQLVIGHNFVWHPRLVNEFKERATILDLNWIETLADYQQLERPFRTHLVTGGIFNSISTVHDVLKMKPTPEFKKWALPYIELATDVNKWLDLSPINYKGASKHPNAEGHQVWADYILQNL